MRLNKWVLLVCIVLGVAAAATAPYWTYYRDPISD